MFYFVCVEYSVITRLCEVKCYVYMVVLMIREENQHVRRIEY